MAATHFFIIVWRCVDEEFTNQNATEEIMLVYYIKQSETKWLAPVKDAMYFSQEYFRNP